MSKTLGKTISATTALALAAALMTTSALQAASLKSNTARPTIIVKPAKPSTPRHQADNATENGCTDYSTDKSYLGSCDDFHSPPGCENHHKQVSTPDPCPWDRY